MSATPDEAHARARDFLCRRFCESLQLRQVNSLPAPVYGFEASGWYLFAVIDQKPTSFGATEYVAVSQRTGEVRYLGRVGQ
jgi:hypothetical protein